MTEHISKYKRLYSTMQHICLLFDKDILLLRSFIVCPGLYIPVIAYWEPFPKVVSELYSMKCMCVSTPLKKL